MAIDITWSKFQIINLLNKFPKHKNCITVIRNGKTIWNPYGLYCKDHGTLLKWVNTEQANLLKECGVEDQRDPDFYEKHRDERN